MAFQYLIFPGAVSAPSTICLKFLQLRVAALIPVCCNVGQPCFLKIKGILGGLCSLATFFFFSTPRTAVFWSGPMDGGHTRHRSLTQETCAVSFTQQKHTR